SQAGRLCSNAAARIRLPDGIAAVRCAGTGSAGDIVDELAQFHTASRIRLAAQLDEEYGDTCRRGNLLCRHQTYRSTVRHGGAALQLPSNHHEQPYKPTTDICTGTKYFSHSSSENIDSRLCRATAEWHNGIPT